MKNAVFKGLAAAFGFVIPVCFGATLQGEIQQGALVKGQTEPGVRVFLAQREVAVTPKGWFDIGFDRDAKATQVLREVWPDGQSVETPLTVKQREYRIQRVTGVPERTVTPDPKHLKRIRDEAALVAAARKRDDRREDFLQPFIWPASGPISGVFGSQRFYNGEGRNPHFGVDVAAPRGAPVVAPGPGIVTLVHPDMFFSGGTLIIDHGYGVSSTFMHLDKVEAKLGQQVKTGDVIGRVGATGRASGPHLDWRMNWFEVRVDPVTWAPPLVNGHTP